ncbi:MAG TPA: FAD:protein FMN transferase, partial [Polyangiaceae bacterium]
MADFCPHLPRSALGLALAALLCSACQRQSTARDAPPAPSVDASRVDAEPGAGTAAPADSRRVAALEPKRVEAKEVAMGTSVTFVAYTNERIDEAGARALFAKAFGEIQRLEALLSEWRETSDVGRINRADGEWVDVGPEALEVIQKGISAGKFSEGTFDITFQAMSDVWKFGDARDSEPKVPKKADILARKKLVDFRKVEVTSGKVRIGKEQRLGLGGIAKGYIVDAAVRILRDGGLVSFLVQAGGDLYGAGTKPDGSRWVSGIQDPRGGSGT